MYCSIGCATLQVCGWIFNDQFIVNFLSMKEF